MGGTSKFPDREGGGLDQLTGDVLAGPGTGSQVATLSETGVTPGAYTNTNLTVDAKGRITEAASADTEALAYGRAVVDGADVETPIAVDGILASSSVVFIFALSAQGFGFDGVDDVTESFVVTDGFIEAESYDSTDERLLVAWSNAPNIIGPANPFNQELNTFDAVEFDGVTSFVQYGTGPFPANGAVRLGNANEDGDTNGVWGYEYDDWGGEIAMLRLTLSNDAAPQITIGDDNFGRVDFDISTDGTSSITPKQSCDLGTASAPFLRTVLSKTSLNEAVDAITPGIFCGDSFQIRANAPAGGSFVPLLASSSGTRIGAPSANGGAGESYLQTTNQAVYLAAGNIILTLWEPGSGVLNAEGYISISSVDSTDDLAGMAYPLDLTGTDRASFWGSDLVGVSANPYFIWYHGTGTDAGVYRVNALGEQAYYNPSFATYEPGAADFERVVQQWRSDVAEIGTEAGGSGTLRALRLLGASVETSGALTATGGFIFPTSDPMIVGAWWNDGGTLTISAAT